MLDWTILDGSDCLIWLSGAMKHNFRCLGCVPQRLEGKPLLASYEERMAWARLTKVVQTIGGLRCE